MLETTERDLPHEVLEAYTLDEEHTVNKGMSLATKAGTAVSSSATASARPIEHRFLFLFSYHQTWVRFDTALNQTCLFWGLLIGPLSSFIDDRARNKHLLKM